MLSLLLIGMLILTFNIQPVKADYSWTETIYIRADGSVDPDTAPISSADNITYTLTDNIVGDVPADASVIVVERDNIVVDGAGYTLQGTGSGTGIYLSYINNVTIKNIQIKAFSEGIWLDYSSNNSISGNNVSSSERGILLGTYSDYNTISNNILANNSEGILLFPYLGIPIPTVWPHPPPISTFNIVIGNTIMNNNKGLVFIYSDLNFIYQNNFVNNTQQVLLLCEPWDCPNVWNDIYPSGGNYWSDYNGTDLYSGPYQNETGSDGIGDTPYVINSNNTDHYPLMNPWTPAPSVITATIDIDPDTLNLKSKGKWITCYIEPPEDYNISDVDRTTILLNDTIPVDSFWLDKPLESVIGDYDSDTIPDLMVKFDRAEVISYIVESLGFEPMNFSEAALTVSGQLYDGTPFEGSDIIRVTMPTVFGTGLGVIRIKPGKYVWGRVELCKIGDEQIELVFFRRGKEYSRAWNIVCHRDRKHLESYFCYSHDYGPFIFTIYKRWQFWWCVGRGISAIGFIKP